MKTFKLIESTCLVLMAAVVAFVFIMMIQGCSTEDKRAYVRDATSIVLAKHLINIPTRGAHYTEYYLYIFNGSYAAHYQCTEDMYDKVNAGDTLSSTVLEYRIYANHCKDTLP